MNGEHTKPVESRTEDQTYFLRMSGRCSNGAERDAGQLVHAIRSVGFPGWRPAVCGAAPGRKGNGWSESDAGLFTAATCRRCLRRLSDEAPSFSPNFDERNGIR